MSFLNFEGGPTSGELRSIIAPAIERLDELELSVADLQSLATVEPGSLSSSDPNAYSAPFQQPSYDAAPAIAANSARQLTNAREAVSSAHDAMADEAYAFTEDSRLAQYRYDPQSTPPVGPTPEEQSAAQAQMVYRDPDDFFANQWGIAPAEPKMRDATPAPNTPVAVRALDERGIPEDMDRQAWDQIQYGEKLHQDMLADQQASNVQQLVEAPTPVIGSLDSEDALDREWRVEQAMANLRAIQLEQNQTQVRYS